VGRRAGSSVPISFFSFQDIVTSVTGILILVTLMLAVDIIDPTRVENASHTPVINDLRVLESELAAISSSIQQKKKQIQSLQQVMAVLGKNSSEDKVTRFKELSDKLSTLKQLLHIRQTQLAGELNELDASQKQLDQIVNEHAAVEAQNHEADLQLLQLSKVPTVKLLPGPSTKNPIIIECKNDNAIIGVLSSQGELSIIQSVSAQRVEKKIDQIFRLFDPQKEYFVIYVHSDATELANRLITHVRKNDFDVGWDLLTDEQRIYQEREK
jgi:hypothetical protein